MRARIGSQRSDAGPETIEPMPQTAVPGADEPLDVLFRFASMTYFGYDRHGGVEVLSRFATVVADRWELHGELPGSLAEARAALFYEARRWHHFGQAPDAMSEAYIRALVARVAELSGGTVPVDREGPTIWLKRARNRWSELR
jgi:hypothetical protein